MTMYDEQSQKPSTSNQQSQNSRAKWAPPSRPMPAQQYLQERAQAGPYIPPPQPGRASSPRPLLEQVYQHPTAPLPSAGAKELIHAPRTEYSQSAQANQPPPKRRRLGIPLFLTLVLLIVLVTVGGIFGQRLLDGAPAQITPAGTTLTGPSGPFVQTPLTPEQVYAIQHLITHMKYKQLASLYVSHMTLDEELGQLIMVEYADTYYSPDLDTMITKLHAGGVIMYEFQMQTFDQTKHDIAEMQMHAKIPLFISTDEEGGPYVHRLSHIYGPRMSASDIAATGDPNVATQQGHKAAHDLLSLGINENLAPDVDVNLVNGYDMVTRTFGNTVDSVITFAGAYMQALQGDGVVACIKHYPGLGDAVTDAHTSLPVVNRTRDQLYSVELAPFKAFIQSPNRLLNPGMIMPTNVMMPAIDPVWPAELSHIFMTDILRKQFGYDGVVLTDALYMTGIAQKWSMPEAAVLALNAGNDMLLGPNGVGEMTAMLDALKAALQNGTLSKARVDEAATRIIALKMQDHLLPAVPPQA